MVGFQPITRGKVSQADGATNKLPWPEPVIHS